MITASVSKYSSLPLYLLLYYILVLNLVTFSNGLATEFDEEDTACAGPDSCRLSNCWVTSSAWSGHITAKITYCYCYSYYNYYYALYVGNKNRESNLWTVYKCVWFRLKIEQVLFKYTISRAVSRVPSEALSALLSSVTSLTHPSTVD